ncbi:MAG TPA: DegV family protein [Anaerolineales bacterium]
MNKVAIVTDSTAYIPSDLLKKYAIKVIPLTIIWEDETFLDGIDIQPDDFYKRLSTAKAMPTTSQVTVMAMQSSFQILLDQGFDVLGIFISSKFSGTVESAMQARDTLPEASGKISLVDSLTTTMAMGWPVITAARAAQAGENLESCRRIAVDARDHSGVLFVVDTLEYLRRGGRIGGAQALLGTALNIKPVLEMRNGQIESVEKVRTKGKALERLLELTIERIGNQVPVRLASVHANAEAEALTVLEAARTRLNPIETLCCPLSPVVGTHAGPGTVALTYMAGVA